MSANNARSRIFDHLELSAVSVTAASSSTPDTSVHSPESTTRVILALVGGVIFVFLFLLFRFNHRFFKKPQGQRLAIGRPRERFLQSVAYSEDEDDGEPRIMVATELNKRFPVQSYKTWRELAYSKDILQYTPNPASTFCTEG